MEILYAVGARIAVLFVEPIVGPILAPIRQWLCYLCDYDSNIQTMENEVENLQMTRERVKNSIDSARRNDEEIEAHVTTWLTKVDEVTKEARKLLQDEERVQTRCSNGACLNLCLRHQLSQKAKKIVEIIGELLENGRWIERHMDYVDLVSRMSTMKGLMEALGDANTNVIGVWGMAGVGKTTLVTEVARQAKEKKLFDEVAMAYVTQSLDCRRIQGEIADMLDLKFDAESVRGRAYRLKQRLTTHKKILVILDDLWSRLNLEEIGIPSTGCKVVLTSRDKDLLSCQMGTQKDFGLEELPKNEAWDLFEKMAGDCVIKDPDLRKTATEVAEECAGLPIALVTVAKALNNKSLYEWNNALQQLRRPAPGNLTRMQSTIYSSIELSYNHLENEEVQHFFLLCAEVDYSIGYQDLLKYCYGLGSFEGIDNLEEARNRLYSHVRNLKDSCLLQGCPHGSDHCHMHDVVRDVAIVIASRDLNMLVVRDNSGLKKWPDVDALKRCTIFSIRGGDTHALPNKMECPDLKLFYVEGRDHSLQIPDTFFEGMGKLQVLDLTKMKFPSLPLSIRLLGNLQTLCLDECVLGDIAVIRELKNLVSLSLSGSDVSQLPEEIGLLARLRLLDLTNCSKLELIPPNVLSRLVELEELYMRNSFVQWEAEGLANVRNNANLAELKNLPQLITLEIHVREARNFPKDLLFEKLQRYEIIVGDLVWDSSFDKRNASRTLKLKLNTSFQAEVGIKMLLKRTEALYLDELKGLNSLLNDSNREDFQQLKHLHIQNNPEIKYVINLKISVVAFPVLETFFLKSMMSLEEICHSQLPSTSFCNLRIVKVEHCDKLNFVFSSSMARGLLQLQELEVKNCSIMGAIVMKEGSEIEDTYTSLFPQLRRLSLEHLPKLMSFLSTQNHLITNAGEIISEEKLNFHMPILHEQVEFPNLEMLELSSVNLAEIEQNQHPARSSCRLTNMQATSRFDNLSDLTVKGSGNIKFILSLSTARSMVQLKHLHILECEVVEEILVTEELRVVEEITPKTELLFPRLECLFLQKLPTLKRFCVGSNIEFQSLKNLRIENCPKLETFISKPLNSGMTISKELKEMSAEETPHSVMQPLFNEEVAFPSLERLKVSHVDCLKIIWKNQFTINSFCKLQFIEIEFCENLMNIFHTDMLTRFQSLETLTIANCGVEEIVAREKGVEPITTFVFPQITHLCLKDLPRLKWFYLGMHASKWPMLKTLRVDRCQKVDIFANSELLSCQETPQESPVEISIKQPLFLVGEATFPNLEFLALGDYDTIWRGQFLEDCFCKLKGLRLCNRNESAVSPPHFVKRVHNLEKLVVCHSDWEEIFPYEELLGQEKHAGILTQLRELNLIELPKLPHLCNEDTQPCPILQNLEILKVSECGKLKILVPSSICFQNLAELEILKCHGLINLVTSSTAKSLVQLKKMSVSECETIAEIVRGEGGEANEVITLSKLTSLKFDCLPQLSNFCSGGYSFEFPSLEEVIVSQCQEMTIFSDGVLSTPKLKRVQATKEDEGHWKDDLNTTIHWLWEGRLKERPNISLNYCRGVGQGVLKERSLTFCHVTTFTQGDKKNMQTPKARTKAWGHWYMQNQKLSNRKIQSKLLQLIFLKG